MKPEEGGMGGEKGGGFVEKMGEHPSEALRTEGWEKGGGGGGC